MRWLISDKPLDYLDSLNLMRDMVESIKMGQAEETIWFLEHNPVYTAGTSSKPIDLINAGNIPVILTDRGGKYTYHGLGQLIIYVMFDLSKRDKDLKKFIDFLQNWIIDSLFDIGILAVKRPDRVGVWILDEKNNTENKIASVGVRVSKWVTYHGIAINIDNDLSHFSGIIPCGIKDYGVTSVAQQGIKIQTKDFIEILKKKFSEKLYF